MSYNEENMIFRSRRAELLRQSALFILAIVLLVFMVTKINSFYSRQNISLIKQSVQRAAVECYSVEGIYPPDIDYLVDNYSLTYNSDRYYIFYETFASNVMPTIEVYERK